ncbi:MAG: halocarboxylic acid dehydrogenase DehI family protein [Halobacteriaceae archaeon]
MDTTAQLYEAEATGWKRGIYDDIKHTFRAPIVNWIWRTTMANYPEFCRYAWSQVKPLFQTRAFARTSVAYREAVYSALTTTDHSVPKFRKSDIDIQPAEFEQLKGQLATFDVVAPRLAVLFEVMDRTLHDDPVGQRNPSGREVTEPFPDWLDRDRGIAPTMIPFETIPTEIQEPATELQSFHGLEQGLPSIYRCLGQWPPYFTRAWKELKPLLSSDGFEIAVTDAATVIDEYVDSVPYSPQLKPDNLRNEGFDDGLIEDIQDLFREFNRGPLNDVGPAIHVFAMTVDELGERRLT